MYKVGTLLHRLSDYNVIVIPKFFFHWEGFYAIRFTITFYYVVLQCINFYTIQTIATKVCIHSYLTKGNFFPHYFSMTRGQKDVCRVPLLIQYIKRIHHVHENYLVIIRHNFNQMVANITWFYYTIRNICF